MISSDPARFPDISLPAQICPQLAKLTMTKAAKAPKTASPKTSSPETDSTWSYEATVAKIEATVTRLEQGELPLAAVFEEFEQAVVDLQQCESFLQARQEQVDLLIETLGDS